MLNEKVSVFLGSTMQINLSTFEEDLRERFGDDASYFNQVLEFLIDDKASTELCGLKGINYTKVNVPFKERFFKYVNSIGLSDDFFEFSYVLLRYFSSYYCGGLQEMFKNRQAEDFGPQIELKYKIVSDNVLSKLSDELIAYRGMSHAEYQSGKAGMSWSLSKKSARGFAFDFYPERGVLVTATIPKKLILHYYTNDSEDELIIPNNSVLEVIVIER
jgi:hypothetical protein